MVALKLNKNLYEKVNEKINNNIIRQKYDIIAIATLLLNAETKLSFTIAAGVDTFLPVTRAISNQLNG